MYARIFYKFTKRGNMALNSLALRTITLPIKQIISLSVFIIVAVFLAYSVPTIEIAWMMAILLLTIYLFAFEVVGR